MGRPGSNIIRELRRRGMKDDDILRVLRDHLHVDDVEARKMLTDFEDDA